MLSTCGFALAYTNQQVQRRWGESTCLVRVSALGSQAHAGKSTMQCSIVMHLHPEDPDTFFLLELIFFFYFLFFSRGSTDPESPVPGQE